MLTMLGHRFTARPSRLPPEGVRTERRPRVLYRSADAPETEVTQTQYEDILRSQQTGEQKEQQAAADIGTAIGDSLSAIFGKKPPPPASPEEKKARDMTTLLIFGAAALVGGVVIYRLMKR